MGNMDYALEYKQQAQQFLEKAWEYLEAGDLHQACEKGWGLRPTWPRRSLRCTTWNMFTTASSGTCSERSSNWPGTLWWDIGGQRPTNSTATSTCGRAFSTVRASGRACWICHRYMTLWNRCSTKNQLAEPPPRRRPTPDSAPAAHPNPTSATSPLGSCTSTQSSGLQDREYTATPHNPAPPSAR